MTTFYFILLTIKVMIDGVDMPPPARGCLSTEGTGRGSTESIMTFISLISMYYHKKLSNG